MLRALICLQLDKAAKLNEKCKDWLTLSSTFDEIIRNINKNITQDDSRVNPTRYDGV
jgi:hypothetical protein